MAGLQLLVVAECLGGEGGGTQEGVGVPPNTWVPFGGGEMGGRGGSQANPKMSKFCLLNPYKNNPKKSPENLKKN